MYLVHQIIVCILYATLCIVFCNRRHVDEEGLNTRYRMIKQPTISGGLAPALYHDDVITMDCFDKR
jgi:hypothetical protein